MSRRNVVPDAREDLYAGSPRTAHTTNAQTCAIALTQSHRLVRGIDEALGETGEGS